jgi:muconolactone D-isomerase
MEFLVRIEVELPFQLGPDERARLLESEMERGRELKDAGAILRIWRIPGRTANVGLWDVADPTALHDAITSLPMFPYLKAEVTPLARHYLSGDEGHGSDDAAGPH